MRPEAVGLILLSAIGHVYWNYQVKRAPDPAVYNWWLLVVATLLFAPFAVWLSWPIAIPARAWYCVAATGLCYAGYYSSMAASYGREDLSRAYPIARGVAPAATAAWGVLFHHEHPSAAGWLGIAAICAGVFALSGIVRPGAKRRLPRAGVLAAVATGLCTSGYSAVDKEGVQLVPPALYIVLTFTAGAIAYGALLWHTRFRTATVRAVTVRERTGVRAAGERFFSAATARERLDLVLASAVVLGSYLLILEVLRFEPVSYVVPLRSISVLLSIGVGSRFLREEGGLPRLAAAALILLGISAIALAG